VFIYNVSTTHLVVRFDLECDEDILGYDLAPRFGCSAWDFFLVIVRKRNKERKLNCRIY
jgi:hypothetical protein